MKIIPLSEGSFTVDKTKAFIPFEVGADVLNERSRGSLLVEIQPFLVVTSKDILLLDTGLGFDKKNGSLQIYENIIAAGYDPSQVTKVLMSHLHKDHSGGIAHPSSAQFSNPEGLNFPNAQYYVQQREMEFALSNNSDSFKKEEIQPLLQSQQLSPLHEDEGEIDDYIHYQLTGAHSSFHQVFWIREGDEVLFFGGDDAPQLQQMRIKYKTKYDNDPEKAMNLRQEWWEKGNSEGWTFLFYHDIKTPTWQKK